ncbi:hypothetical protein T439DRAFT_349735 [Meredithblackwellia eburnea MCA 4105]
MCGESQTMEGGELLQCSGCSSSLYCSAQCQLNDWKAHKAVCNLGSFQNNRYLAHALQPLDPELPIRPNDELSQPSRVVQFLSKWVQQHYVSLIFGLISTLKLRELSSGSPPNPFVADAAHPFLLLEVDMNRCPTILTQPLDMLMDFTARLFQPLSFKVVRNIFTSLSFDPSSPTRLRGLFAEVKERKEENDARAILIQYSVLRFVVWIPKEVYEGVMEVVRTEDGWWETLQHESRCHV